MCKPPRIHRVPATINHMSKSSVESKLSSARSAAGNIEHYTSAGDSVQAGREAEAAIKKLVEAVQEMAKDLYGKPGNH